MADEIVLKVVLESDLAEKSVGELKQDFKDLTQQLNNTKVGTEEYKKSLQSLGVVKGGLQDLKQQIAALNPERQFAAIARLGSTVANGFAAAQAGAALFGGESEDLMKVLVRVQAATALASGLQGLAGFGKALETARTAMIAFALSNPLTAIAAGIVALTATIYGLVQAFDDTQEKADKLTKSNDYLKDSFKRIGDETDLLVRKLKATGASEQEIFEARQKQRDDELANQKERISVLTALFNSETGLTDEQFKELQALEVERDITKRVKAIEELEFHKEMTDKGIKVTEDALDKAEADQKKADAKSKKAAEDAENTRREKSLRDQKYNEEQLKIHQQFLQGIAEIEKEEADKANAERQRNDDIEAESELRMYQFRKDLLQARLDAQKAIQLAEIQLAQGGIAIFTALAGKNKQIADALFVVDKALAIATIVVNTQKEIAGVYASPLVIASGGLASPLGASLAIGAKIRAAAGIATILATTVAKFMNGGSADSGPAPSGGSVSTPNISSPQAQENTFQQQQGTQTNTNAQGDFTSFKNNQNPLKVYVLESDITSTQTTVAKIEQNSKY